MLKLALSFLFIASSVAASCGIDDALQSLTPAAQWSLAGNSYEGITWLDTVQAKPTKSQVLQAVTDCDTNAAARHSAKVLARSTVKDKNASVKDRLEAIELILDLDQ